MDAVKKTTGRCFAACADNAKNATTAIEALQYTQAALNAANALIGLHLNLKV